VVRGAFSPRPSYLTRKELELSASLATPSFKFRAGLRKIMVPAHSIPKMELARPLPREILL